MAKVKLLPGERELARTPPRWVAWTVTSFMLSMPASFMALDFMDLGKRDIDPVVHYVLLGVTALNLLIQWPILRWRIMVTDRRVLIRRGWLKREVEEIAREDIQSVRSDSFLVRIEARDRMIEAPCHSFFVGRLLAVIDPDRAAQARPAAMFGNGLETGEEVLLRSKSQLPLMLAGIVLAILPMVQSNYRLLDRENGLDGGDLVVLLGFPGVMGLAIVALMLAFTRSQIQWLMTGRRLLTVQGVFRRRIEDIPLDRIENTDFDGSTLTLHGGGHRLDIPLGPVREDELQRVLGRWFPWQSQPAAPAESLLRDGETILLRRPWKWLPALAGGGTLAVVLAMAGYLVWRMSDRGFDFGLLAGVLIPAAAVLIYLPQLRGETGWSLLVTDRRVLIRRPHDHTRYDELPLDAIEEIAPIDKHLPRVRLRAQGRDHVIPTTSEKSANRIRETIEQAKGAARWRG